MQGLKIIQEQQNPISQAADRFYQISGAISALRGYETRNLIIGYQSQSHLMKSSLMQGDAFMHRWPQ